MLQMDNQILDIETTNQLILEMNSQITYFNNVITILIWIICGFMLLTLLTIIFMLCRMKDTNEKVTNLLEYREMKDEDIEAKS